MFTGMKTPVLATPQDSKKAKKNKKNKKKNKRGRGNESRMLKTA